MTTTSNTFLTRLRQLGDNGLGAPLLLMVILAMMVVPLAPPRDVMTGEPSAIASAIASPNPSASEGNKTARASRIARTSSARFTQGIRNTFPLPAQKSCPFADVPSGPKITSFVSTPESA